MNKLDRSLRELREMDTLAAGTSPVHGLCPIAKLLTTIAYIAVVLSFGKYQLSGLLVMMLWPLLLFQLSGIPVATCFRKLRFVLPLVLAVGLFNPIFDRSPLLTIGTVTVSGGVVSMITLMAKGVFCLMASFLLVATTPIDSLCAALRRLHVPSVLVQQPTHQNALKYSLSENTKLLVYSNLSHDISQTPLSTLERNHCPITKQFVRKPLSDQLFLRTEKR